MNPRFTARAIEVIYNGHQDGNKIITFLRKKKWGLYKAFIKWHNGNEDDGDEKKTTHTCSVNFV